MKDNFIVGNWYQHFMFPKTKAKFLKINNGSFIGSEWICGDDGYFYKEAFYSNVWKESKPISIDEIKQFLPEGHPDLENSNANANVNYEVY